MRSIDLEVYAEACSAYAQQCVANDSEVLGRRHSRSRTPGEEPLGLTRPRRQVIKQLAEPRHLREVTLSYDDQHDSVVTMPQIQAAGVRQHCPPVR